MSERITYRTKLLCSVRCEECDFVVEGANGLGLAAKHTDRYCHTTHVDVERGVIFSRKGTKYHNRMIELGKG